MRGMLWEIVACRGMLYNDLFQPSEAATDTFKALKKNAIDAGVANQKAKDRAEMALRHGKEMAKIAKAEAIEAEQTLANAKAAADEAEIKVQDSMLALQQVLRSQLSTWLHLTVDKQVPPFLLFLLPRLCDGGAIAAMVSHLKDNSPRAPLTPPSKMSKQERV